MVRSSGDLVRRLVDALAGDLDALTDVLDPGYVLHKPGFSTPIGPEAFRMYAREWRRAFPDCTVRIAELVAEGDLVACRVDMAGTHRGTFLGTPATGRTISITGTELHRVVDGRVAESWLADDVPRILTDTGVMAPTGAGASRWT